MLSWENYLEMIVSIFISVYPSPCIKTNTKKLSKSRPVPEDQEEKTFNDSTKTVPLFSLSRTIIPNQRKFGGYTGKKEIVCRFPSDISKNNDPRSSK